MTRKRTPDPFATEGTATSLADRAIVVVREQPVILDSQLAELFGVTTGVLNQAVRRNADRFPSDFVIRLTSLELGNLKSQTVISSSHGGRRTMPLAFTEHGAVMAATVLNSPRAVEISIFVVRAFVRIRTHTSRDAEVRRQILALSGKVDSHDKRIIEILDYLHVLTQPPFTKERRKIGFRSNSDDEAETVEEEAAEYKTLGKKAKRTVRKKK